MNQGHIISCALASVLSMGLVAQVSAQAMADGKGKEKCFGVAKAGQNDCANISGTHSCAGQSKVDASVEEWKYVAAGTCKGMKGMSADEAKMKAKK